MSHPTCCCSVSLDRCDRCDLLVDLVGFHLMGVARTLDTLVLDRESCDRCAGCPGCGVNRTRSRALLGTRAIRWVIRQLCVEGATISRVTRQ